MSEPVETTARTIADIVRRWSAETPGQPCLSFADRTSTWREVFDRSSRIGQGLVQAGLQPQDRVIYLDKNGPEFFEIVFGASMSGLVTAAVNWRLAPREMSFVINHSQARILFIGHEFLGRLAKFRAELTTVETIVVIGGGGEDDYETWLARQVAKDPETTVADADTALQMYTSGTTGLPKGVMFSNAAVHAKSAMSEVTGVTARSVALVAMPVFHAAGASLGLMALGEGAQCVIAREVSGDSLLSLIERHRVTTTTLVPAVLKMLLETPGMDRYDVSSLECLAYAASPISRELLRASLDRFRCGFVQIYGLTETNGATVLSPEDHLDERHPERLVSAGRPLPGVTVRTVDPETGEDVGEGVVGEVWVKAPTNMHGYWAAPEETAAALTADGFVRSGDGGYLKDGYLYLRDRIKDMILSGGENVYPIEVERVLMSHPCINDAAVIGVPSEKWGETVKAIVVRARPELTEAEVISYAKTNLAGYKCPKSVEFVGELPRNPSGKLLKRVLRESYWRGRERRVG